MGNKKSNISILPAIIIIILIGVATFFIVDKDMNIFSNNKPKVDINNNDDNNST